jgi:hypothetical protein
MNTSLPNQPPNSPDPLAITLAKLEPAPHGFDWNSLMFAAGRESKARALFFWKALAGLFAVLAGGFAFAYFAQLSQPVQVQRTIYVDRIVPVQPKPLEPLPEPEPLPLPLPQPQPQPQVPPTRLEWEYETPAAPNVALRWLNTRNEILMHGLGVLPDTGPKLSPPPRADY